MTLLSSQIEMMKRTAQLTFTDICTIHTLTTNTSSSLGEETKTFTDTANVPCGFVETSTTKNFRGEVVSFDCDAIVRLSLTRDIDLSDEITCRNSRYKISGINQGRTVNIVKLKRVVLNG